METQVTNLIVLVVTTLLGVVFKMFIKPLIDKKIDTEEEKRIYYKSLRLLVVADDIYKATIADKPKKLTTEIIEAMISKLIELTGVERDTAERVMKSVIINNQ